MLSLCDLPVNSNVSPSGDVPIRQPRGRPGRGPPGEADPRLRRIRPRLPHGGRGLHRRRAAVQRGRAPLRRLLGVFQVHQRGEGRGEGGGGVRVAGADAGGKGGLILCSAERLV